MGNAKSSNSKKKCKLPREDMDYLLEKTCFTEKQIKEWYKGYMKDCPEGSLTRSKFLDLYSEFFPDSKAKSFYEHVFRTFDEDNSGAIDFKEFLVAISITKSGEPEEKLALAFRLYDIDRNGTIEEHEMTEILKAIYSLVGREPQLESSPKERARSIFKKMDTNCDGVLTKDEFVQGCLKDETLFNMLTTNNCGISTNGKDSLSE
ncbi:neuronal calcium sensor 2 [Lingula anatina]|uniref:Neuronal calcium sensor 2 n=1 Tax=Lingula anatina TaxID=7574 RepID=A0A1S3H6U6_LINAN|nr:neuronal calcium sensor 2 [Lingula anatina]|eukprot:XP_013380849.1 neuronal calcium sensor 2 [Lingula anatina]